MKGDYSQIQLCPKCDGQGYVSRPPWLPGDVTTWTSTQISYLCDVCNGSKYFRVHLESCDDLGRLLAEINDFKCCGNCKLFFD